ncbi:electrogenic aspartate/glutamate antiporter SLC25A13, mitochondrial isoform X2 [Hydra vulgaris]|uniref:Electrogenic aspartate/glutamate antiporter SLC25A13, mitochondrial isoform X2 n=1 Tax=Hydra vulgaris TaxID=6087 RepID=A0ABM4CT08_HYDVU
MIFKMLLQQASCEAPLYDYAVKKADPKDLRTVFNKYATIEKDGERFMSPTALVRDFLLMDGAFANEKTLSLLSGVVNQSKDGLISFHEFQAFETLLCKPDAKFRVVFEMFDKNRKGSVTFDEFKKVFDSQLNAQKYPFNYESEFIKNYFGAEKDVQVNYHEFTQLITDLNKEYMKQLFQQKAGQNNFITAAQLVEIMKVGCSHKLSQFTLDNIMAMVMTEATSNRVSFIYFSAFYDLLNNFDLVEKILQNVDDNSKYKEISKEQLLLASQRYPQISPLQIDILFDILNASHPDKSTVSRIESKKLLPKVDPMSVFSKIHQHQIYEDEVQIEQPLINSIAESGYRFFLGSLAGASGAAFVYPIDLVKTRMQNQRSVIPSERMYQNSFDCFRKVVANEGIAGLYRGLIPQLIGVSPEKAIKLTTNDTVRKYFTDKDGEIRLIGEILAGGCGGGAQVMFTNPIEIVKIRMQVAGELGVRPSALELCRELGFTGLYKGARACFLRDIPFSAIYFPCYAHFKKSSADHNGYNNPLSLLLSAAAAGVPAAYLCTPADVIKTRLQVKARRGQQTYRGVIDCARKIYVEEGGTAFFKGGPARVLRSSPQFGVTLMVYEMLQRFLYIDFGGGYTKTEVTPENPEVSLHPEHIGGLRLAVSTFSGIETRFGLMLPKFNDPPKLASKTPMKVST